MPHLRSAARRERWPARPHRSDQGNAGKPARTDAADRCAHRPVSFLHVVHDHLRGESRLHASGRYGARAHRGQLPASAWTAHRPSLARPRFAAPRPVPDGARSGPPGQALLGGAAALPAQRIAPDSRTTPGRPAPIPLPACGERKWRVALLAGCVQPVLSPHINDATIRLLTRLGCEVVVPASAACCGSLNLHMGNRKQARNSPRPTCGPGSRKSTARAWTPSWSMHRAAAQPSGLRPSVAGQRPRRRGRARIRAGARYHRMADAHESARPARSPAAPRCLP